MVFVSIQKSEPILRFIFVLNGNILFTTLDRFLEKAAVVNNSPGLHWTDELEGNVKETFCFNLLQFLFPLLVQRSPVHEAMRQNSIFTFYIIFHRPEALTTKILRYLINNPLLIGVLNLINIWRYLEFFLSSHPYRSFFCRDQFIKNLHQHTDQDNKLLWLGKW